MGNYERSQLTMYSGLIDPATLAYDPVTGHYFASRVTLTYQGHDYGLWVPPGEFAPGHQFVYDLSNYITIGADPTEVHDAGVTPPDAGIDGAENVDGLLVDGAAVSMGYTMMMCAASRTAAVKAALVAAGATIALEIPNIFLQPTDGAVTGENRRDYIGDLRGTLNWVIYVLRENETAIDSGDGLTFNLAGKFAEAPPEALVYVGEDEDSLVLQTSGYTFNYGGPDDVCSVTFGTSQTGKVVTATYLAKRRLTASEEPYQFEMLPREQLAVNFLDIAGRAKIVTSGGEKQGPRGVTLGWRYQRQEFWDFWREIADNHWRFDVFYAGNQYPDRLITNLFPTEYPDKKHVANTAPQMVDFAITGMVVDS